MKAENAIARIEKVANKRLKAYKLIIDAMMAKANTIRPCYTSGRGRFTSNLDYTNDVKDILNRAGVKFTLTNDSPRGGLTGNIITLTHIAY